MNSFTLAGSSRRSMTATGVAGVLATTAVAALLSAASSVSAYAAPSWRPAPPDLPVIVTAEPRRSEPTHLCFMGRHNWPTEAVGPQPLCQVRS